MSEYSEAQKRTLCDRLNELVPSQTKEIYALIQEYAGKSTASQVKRLGGKATTPYGAHKVGDDYVFDINQLPTPLLVMIERLLEVE